VINADEIARQVKSPRSSNIVMLGAASPFLDLPYESLESGIRIIFGRKRGEGSSIKYWTHLKPDEHFALEHTPVGSNLVLIQFEIIWFWKKLVSEIFCLVE